jgi:YD repeat-containing protein
MEEAPARALRLPIWGNLTSRTYNATTATLTYDVLDHLVAWNAGSTNQEWYLYDASGNRVLRRSASTTTGGNPATSAATITTYAFGVEEHVYQYSGSGSSATTKGRKSPLDLTNSDAQTLLI